MLQTVLLWMKLFRRVFCISKYYTVVTINVLLCASGKLDLACKIFIDGLTPVYIIRIKLFKPIVNSTAVLFCSSSAAQDSILQVGGNLKLGVNLPV